MYYYKMFQIEQRGSNELKGHSSFTQINTAESGLKSEHFSSISLPKFRILHTVPLNSKKYQVICLRNIDLFQKNFCSHVPLWSSILTLFCVTFLPKNLEANQVSYLWIEIESFQCIDRMSIFRKIIARNFIQSIGKLHGIDQRFVIGVVEALK